MKIWFDTEFIEDGRTIDLLSIGMVREDGATFYLENRDADLKRANPWVQENVIPYLGKSDTQRVSRDSIAFTVQKFAGDSPEFWAYYGAYDWVALCQLYGPMIELPKGWPMFVRDIKQFAAERGNPELPKQRSGHHHALHDALWNRRAWEFLARLNPVEAVG